MPLRRARRRPSMFRRPVRGVGGSSSFPFTITGFSPPAVLVGSPDTVVDVLGGSFPVGSQIYVNGALRATTYVNASLLRFTVTAAEAATQKLLSVQVRTVTQASNAVFLPVAIATPTIATRAPTFGYRGEGNVSVAITGTGIYPSTTATANGAPIGFTFGSTTTGTITVPSATAIGDYTLALLNAPPGGGPSNGVMFQMRLRAPVALSLSATSLVIGRPNAPVTITGQASPATFYPDSVVEVDGVAVPSTTVSGSSIQFTFPAEVASVPGFKTVRVRNPTAGAGGGLSSAFSFEFIPFPTLIAIDITEVVQYFDGFPARTQYDRIDAGFVVTFNDVAQPTVFVDPQTMTVNITSAACAVPGTTLVRARDTISGLSTDAIPFIVSPFDPLNIGAPLRLWLDGTSLEDDGTGRAQQWTDKSGGGRHITQPTAAKRPLIVATSSPMNGRPAARFDSTRQDALEVGLSWLTIGAAGIITKTAYNIWVVAQTTSAAATQAVLGETNGRIYACSTSDPPEQLDCFNLVTAGNTSRPLVNYNWKAGAAFAFRSRKDSTNIYARVNRSGESTVALGEPQTGFTPNAVFIGYRSSGGGFWNGDIAEVIVANEDLNFTFKAILDNMLSYKYGLPFSTPGTAPSISSISPNTVEQLDLPFDLNVYDTGNSFTASSVVNVKDVPLATTFVGAGQVRARIPQSALVNAGGLAITVADAGGISGPKGLTVLPRPPVAGPNLYALSVYSTPRFNNALTGVVCTGSGFTPSSVAYAGATPCTTVYDNPNQLTITIPKSALTTMPGPQITIHDGAAVSNALEITLTDWSPLTIAGLTIWLRADAVTLGTGSEVAQMNDLSGFGRHFTQATTTKRPLLIASDARFNGQPTVDFDGVDDYMSGSTMAAAFSAIAGIHYGVVFRADAITGNGAITSPFANNCVCGGAGGFTGTALRNTLVAYCYGNGAGVYYATSTPVAVGVTYCAYVEQANDAINSTINGVTATVATVSATYTSATALSLGSNVTFTGNFLNGQVAEYWTSNQTPTAQDIICWKNYCNYRYATP